MKRTVAYIVFIFISFNAFAQEELIGKWIRTDDATENPDAWKNENYDGYIIEITKSDSGIIGISIKVPQGAIIHGYSAGQIKWKDFKKLSGSKFEIKGLLMVQGNSEAYDTPSYIQAFVKILNNNTIKVWVEDESYNIGGKKQKWIRIPNS